MRAPARAALLLATALGAPLAAQTIDTIAGNGSPGFSGDGGAACKASISPDLDLTANVAVDPEGNVFLADTNSNRIRRIDAGTGVITTVAGTGAAGGDGDGGPAALAQLSSPTDLVFDRQGRLVVADAGNNRVRRIDLSAGTIETIAGSGALGYSGDGGPAAAAAFEYPASVAYDAAGNLWIADTWNARIRRVDSATGIVTTVAGAGCFTYGQDGLPALSACFTLPTHIRIAPDGAAVIAVNGDSRVVRIDPITELIGTVAGRGGVSGYSGDGGPAATALLAQPNGVAFDRAGNLYIADWQSHRIRKVDTDSGLITTVAGNGRSPGNALGTFSGDGGPAAQAGLAEPTGVTVDRRGNLFIVDALNARVRRVTRAAPVVVTLARVARGSGVVSDLVLTNRGGEATRVRLRYAASGGGVFTKRLVVAAHAAVRFDDVHDLAGAPDGSGALRVSFGDVTDPSLVSAVSRVMTAAPAGLHGPLDVGVDPANAGGFVRWLIGLHEGDGRHSDLVLVHEGGGSAQPLRLELAVFAPDGARAGDPRVVEIASGDSVRIPHALGAAAAGAVRVRSLQASDDFLAEAVVLDEEDGDERLVFPASGDGLVPVVVDAGSIHTSLELFRAADDPAAARLTYTPAPGLLGGGSVLVPMGARQSVTVDDLAGFLARQGLAIGDRLLGSLRVEGASAEAFVAAGETGSRYAAEIPAVPPAAVARRRAFVDGLRQDGTTRSNVAVTNASSDPAPVPFSVRLFDGATGAEVRHETLTLCGGEWAQIASALLGTGAVTGWARIDAPPGARFVAYGIVADGAASGERTSAPAWVPMTGAE